MGVLLHVRTGAEHTLSARVLVGRSGSSLLRLQASVVSGEHATMSWTGSAWELRDLGSTNGTWIGERRLQTGERVELVEGDAVGFGTRGDLWRLIDAGPPTALARPVQGGAAIRSEGGVLALPSADAPEKVLFEVSEGQWLIEVDSAQEPVRDLAVIEAGGAHWRLYLPISLPRTLQSDGGAAECEAALRFAVSRDEEYVELTVICGDRSMTLKPRSFHYLLLTLARLRAADGDASLRERGWVYIDDLARQLGIDAGTVNVYLMRARQQLGEAGVPPGALIERRPGARLRLGAVRATIDTL